MPNFCLIPSEVDRFKQKLLDGTINPAKLADMTSTERHAFFKDITGEANATGVNALFEEKLLLKNQQRGMVTWAKKVSGITPETRRDMIARISRLDKVLDPGDQKAFLHDLAETKLGVSVSPTEAKTIANMSRKVEDNRAKIDGTPDHSPARLAYGRAVTDLENYVLGLKQSAQKLKPLDLIKHPIKTASLGAAQMKGIQASMDNSAIFRQGWKTLFTNPITWQRNARKSFSDLVRQLGNKPVMDEIRADIISRTNADLYKKMKLDIGTLEEPFPTSIPSKIPGIGRVYHASESAYTGFVYRMRADVADKYLEIAKKSGVNIKDPKELQSIGRVVNALTGRGDLGSLEKIGGTVNNFFFSPRFLKSNIDLFLQPLGRGGAHTAFARKQAAVNLVKVISGTAAVLAIANAVRPGSVEWDPRSSDFGKIKIGDTRFDVTGGIDGIVTLASRLVTWSSKSSVTGQVTKLNSGKFGSQTEADVVTNFFENKLSPAAGFVRDLLKGQNPQGQTVKPNDPKSLLRELGNTSLPLGVNNYNELKNDPNSANTLLAMIADGLGIVTNSYGVKAKDWSSSTSKEITQFKGKVSQQDFQAANNEYNQKVQAFVAKASQDSRYKNMPQAQQQTIITAAENKIRAQVFKSHGFEYKQPKSNGKQNKDFINSVGL